MTKDLSQLFYPKSIAIIGASRSKEKLGNIVLKNIVQGDYKGDVFPVNPKAESILTHKCFPDLESIPVIPELAIVALPQNLVLTTMVQICKKGIKNVVVFTAGFKETGAEGADLERQIIALADQNKINLLGPNCLGFVNNIIGLNATFGKVERTKGNLKFISQSGAIATSIFDWAEHDGVGFSQFITMGNKACLHETDILSYWNSVEEKKHASKSVAIDFPVRDKRLADVNPIGLYLESIEEGEDFLNVVSQVTLKNPVFLLKPGKSSSAKKAMQSHTGAIAGEDAVLEAALKQAGVIRCNGIEDLFDFSKAFSWENAPEGPNIAIISNAGGPAVTSADFVEQEGLKLAAISDVTKKRLERFLPASASTHNPIDVLGDALADRYGNSIDAVLGQHDIHGLIVILTPQIMTQIYQTAEYIGRLSSQHKKPIICSFMGGANIAKGERVLNLYKIPSYRFPERAIRAMGAMWKWKNESMRRSLRIKRLTTDGLGVNLNIAKTYRVNQLINLVKRDKRKVFNGFEANEMMKSWDIKTPPSERVTSVFDCLMFTYQHGWPVVLKLSSSKILHKSDLGGVIHSITNKARLETAIDLLESRVKKLPDEIQETVSLQIQRHVPSGVEVILGIKKDPVFGNVLMFGAGGIQAEVIQDRNLQLLPIDRYDGTQLVKQSKIYTILKGYRGDKPYALSKLYATIEKLAELAETFPEISEIEINPLIITHDDVWAVDSKVIIQ